MKKNRLNAFRPERKGRWVYASLKYLFVTVFLLNTLTGIAQEQIVSLNLKNVSLPEVFITIERNTPYSFVFKSEDAEHIKGLTVQLKDRTVKEVLDYCLQNTGLVYEQENNLIIIRKTQQETKMIQAEGKVMSRNGEPLPGVTVIVQGQSWGTSTDAEGRFRISFAEQKNAVLEFSFIGMRTRKVTYTGKNNIDVILEEDNIHMDEVVVTGYQVVDKKKLTSAITSVKAEDVLIPGVNSIDQMLQGRIPDMIMMTNSGEVGVVPRIRIRGTSTLIGNREPLWVVDGIIVNDPVAIATEELNDPDYINRIGNAISGLNPQDIERIDVLKDASATALYGSRAANGVIVITTKKGEIGRMQVRYNVTGTFKLRPRYTDRKINVMNSKERIQFSKELADNHHVFPTGMPQLGYEGLWSQLYRGSINHDQFVSGVQSLEAMNTDWFDILTKDVFSHQHTISISGGTQQIRYYSSIGYNKENDVIRGADNERYTANINLDAYFTQRFTASLSMNGNVSKRRYQQASIAPVDYAYKTSRAIPAFDEDGGEFYYKKDNESYNFNILNELDNSGVKQDGSGVTLNANLNYKATDWLNIQAILSYQTSATDIENYWNDRTNYIAELRRSEYGVEAPKGENTSSSCPFGGELNINHNRNNSYTARLQVDLNKSFGSGLQHNIIANLGYEASSSRVNGYTRIDRGYYDDRGKQFATSINLDDYPQYKQWMAGNMPRISDNLSNMISAYLSVSYSYRDWFTLNANTRIDGSNKFGSRSNEKLLPIWSVSGAYNISDHTGMDSRWVSNLALRLSYGYQGNMLDGQSPAIILKKLPLDAHYNELVSNVEIYPNPDLKWEKTSSFNVGLDFGLFDDALQVNGSYYYKLTKDAFLDKAISSVNGKKTYVINSGEIKNSGFSIDLTTSPISTSDFRWTISTSLSRTFNEMSSQPGAEQYELDDFLSGNALTKGHAVGTFYSYRFLGLNPVDGGPMFDNLQERKEIFNTMNKYDVYTTVLTPSGQRDPKIQGGLSTSFRYKSLRLSASFTYSLGSKVRLFRLFEDGVNFNVLNNVNKDLLARWKYAGDERYTDIPALINGNSVAARYYNSMVEVGSDILIADNAWDMYNYSDHRVVSGNYLQCQNISLTYDIPSKYLKKAGLQLLSVTASATNLFTVCSSKLKGQTPIQSGFAEIQLSERPTFSLGLNVAF